MLALTDQRAGGNNQKLTASQRADLRDMLRQYTPHSLFGTEAASATGKFWTLADLRRGVTEWYGVTYDSPTSYVSTGRSISAPARKSSRAPRRWIRTPRSCISRRSLMRIPITLSSSFGIGHPGTLHTLFGDVFRRGRFGARSQKSTTRNGDLMEPSSVPTALPQKRGKKGF